MPYSTPEMVRMALIPTPDGELPDPASNTGADLSDDQIDDAIEEADSFIDGMIGKYYAVPVASVDDAIPHPIDYWSRNIAAYNATLSFREGLDFTDNDPVARRYKATMAMIQAVSDGTAVLQIPVNTSSNAGFGVGKNQNPYIGDLFDPRDFNLRPMSSRFPLWPDIIGGFPSDW